MAELFPSFARKREADNHAVYVKALVAVQAYANGLAEPQKERFQCLVADVARILAWGAGRRDWISLTHAATRQQGEEFPVAIRRMGLAESLETALWISMRAHPNTLYRNALALVLVRLHLGTAWVHADVLRARDGAGNLILDAFETAELDPGRAAELTAEEFRVGQWPVGGDIFAAIAESVFSRDMDQFSPLTESSALNGVLRTVFDIDPPARDRGNSPCYDLALRNMRDIGVKGAVAEVAKIFPADIAQAAVDAINPEKAAHVEQGEAMRVAAEMWGLVFRDRVTEIVGADTAAELRRRCHATMTYGRATAPAFILLAMAAESRWLALAGEDVPAAGRESAMANLLESGGSWPSIVPPADVSVRAADQAEEPPLKAIAGRNNWTGRQFKWYWVVLVLALMLYGWAAKVGLF